MWSSSDEVLSRKSKRVGSTPSWIAAALRFFEAPAWYLQRTNPARQCQKLQQTGLETPRDWDPTVKQIRGDALVGIGVSAHVKKRSRDSDREATLIGCGGGGDADDADDNEDAGDDADTGGAGRGWACSHCKICIQAWKIRGVILKKAFSPATNDAPADRTQPAANKDQTHVSSANAGRVNRANSTPIKVNVQERQCTQTCRWPDWSEGVGARGGVCLAVRIQSVWEEPTSGSANLCKQRRSGQHLCVGIGMRVCLV
eukprot:1307776-Rhodomonas_salina.3